MTRLRWLTLMALFCICETLAVEPDDYAFQLSAQVAYSPPRLILRWPINPARQISVRRKLPTEAVWGPVIATLPAGSTALTDFGVDVGQVYEYQFSGVLSDVREGPLTPVTLGGHPGLMLLYAERLALHEKPAWVPEGPALEYVELAWRELGKDPSALRHAGAARAEAAND